MSDSNNVRDQEACCPIMTLNPFKQLELIGLHSGPKVQQGDDIEIE